MSEVRLLTRGDGSDGIELSVNNAFLYGLDYDDLVALMCNTLSFLQERQPRYLLAPELRTMLELHMRALENYLDCEPDREYRDHVPGVIFAAPNNLTRRIEWTALDFDPETDEPIGGRRYCVSRGVAFQWVKGILGACANAFDVSQIVALRQELTTHLDKALRGESEQRRVDGLIQNAFAAYAERHKHPGLRFLVSVMKDDELGRLRTFCDRHRPLQLTPERIVRAAMNLGRLKVAAVSGALKAADLVFAGMKAMTLRRSSAELLSMTARESPTIGELEQIALQSFDTVFTRLLSDAKAQLIMELGSKVTLQAIPDLLSSQLTKLVVSEVCQAVNGQQGMELSERMAHAFKVNVRSWWQKMMADSFRSNELIGLVANGPDTGAIVTLSASEARLVYPVRRATPL